MKNSKQLKSEDWPSLVDDEVRHRLLQGDIATFDVMGSCNVREASARESYSPSEKDHKDCDSHSHAPVASDQKNIMNKPFETISKYKLKLFRITFSVRNQCLLLLVLLTMLVLGGASATVPSCFKCGLRPSHSQESSAEEGLRSPREEMEINTKADTLTSTKAPTQSQLTSPSVGSLASEGPKRKSQLGELCGPRLDCAQGLQCSYSVPDTLGVCRETQSLPCEVNGTTYEDRSTFHPDCRTECTCTGGTYACASLCPEESRPPSAACRNPVLRPSEHLCCRQWACDPDPDAMDPRFPHCEVSVSRWSACSSLACGLGLSQRWATDQVSCRRVMETRLCQLRPCRASSEAAPRRQMRRSHHCKATIRTERPQRLVAGPCVSQKRYRLKQCNTCSGTCCSDFMDTSLEVGFLCPLHSVPLYLLADSSLSPVDQASLFDSVTDLDTKEGRLGDLTAEGEDHYDNVTATNYEVVVKLVQWIVRCRCTPTCQTPHMLSTTPPAALDLEFTDFGES